MDSFITPLSKAAATNATDSSFPSRVATLTQPSGGGVFNLSCQGNKTRSNVLIIPFGAGADNATMSVRVIAWRFVTTLWIPLIVCEVSCTLSTSVGVAATEVLNTDRFADTLSLTFGNAGVDCQIFSPANNTPAHVMLDAKGASLIELVFTTGGSATSCNALVASL